jgi:hypothetical protein
MQDVFYGPEYTHQCHSGSSEAADGHNFCAYNSSGMHDPPVPVAAFDPCFGDSVLQALLWWVLSSTAIIISPATPVCPADSVALSLST